MGGPAVMADFEVPADELTPAQRALLDGVAFLTGGELGTWADSLAVSRWAVRERSVWVAGGGVAFSLERRGLVEVGLVELSKRTGKGRWARGGRVIRLTPEGVVEQFAGAQ